jgi:predicted amidohydrolase YtcJ
MLILLTAYFSAGCGPTSENPADLVLIGGTVVTADSTLPEATAVAIVGDRIVAVGSDADVRERIGANTEVIELDGRLAIPGFIESHGHYIGLGNSKMILDLQDVASWEEIVTMVGAVASDAPAGQWILGHGWHQEKWNATPEGSVEGYPIHDALTAASPNNPVVLGHASGHGSFANGRALELGGIDASTRNPPGGEIVRDADGEATGYLREKAQLLVRDASAAADSILPETERRAKTVRAIQLAAEEALANGVTSFHDAGANFETIDLFRELAAAGELPMRLYTMVRFETNESLAARLPNYLMTNFGDGFLTVRSIKKQIDGALGSHGAWLLEPYVDLTHTSGLALEGVEEIRRTAEIAAENGFQLNTHAIGDRANREVLDIYQEVFGRNNLDPSALRWRIEHAQHMDPADVQRFADMGIIAAMQGVHATSDAPWIPSRIGDARAQSGAYLWRSLIDAGVVLANGTDVPVERINPFASFYAYVSRRDLNGDVFYADERTTREEALASYTINGAYAAFEDDVKGSITVGKYADIVVLSDNIMTIPEERILQTSVVYTILGGEIRFSSQPQ